MDFNDKKIPLVKEYIDENLNIFNDNTCFDDSVKLYLNEIKNFPLLTSSEEEELFNLYRKNQDKIIFNRLCKANLRLVVSIAFKYYDKLKYSNFNTTILDLIQEGNMGLMYAINGYKFGDNFSTYATHCIKGYILRGVYNKESMIRKPINVIEKMQIINKVVEDYENMYDGNIPTINQISILTGLSENTVLRCLNCDNKIVSLNIPITEEDEELLNVIPDDILTDEQAINNYLHDEIAAILEESLNERNRDIVKLHYGFNDKLYSFEEISNIYGVTCQRIRQINNQSLEKLGNNPKIKKLRKDYF